MDFTYANMGVDIAGMMFSLTLVICMLIDGTVKGRNEKVEMTMFLSEFLYFWADLVCCIIRGRITNPAVVQTFNIIFYISTTLLLSVLSWYIIYITVDDGSKKRWVQILKVIVSTVAAVNMILIATNPLTGLFFVVRDGLYARSNTFFISGIFYFFFLTVDVVLILMTTKKFGKRSMGLIALIALPIVGIPLQFLFYGLAVTHFSIITMTLLDYIFIYTDKKIEMTRTQKMLAEANIRIMLSQIQPHFIYNSLSSISEMCDINPKEAQRLTDDFAEYLRADFSALTTNVPISFEQELKQVGFYLSLEKARFNDRLNVVYDIKSSEFTLPTLTIEPLVENAVRHGICKRDEGGTVTIRSYETDSLYVVEIEDDGVGFDVNASLSGERVHVGLQNVRSRLAAYNGRLDVISEKGKGTKVTVSMPK
ncbi:MAG: histidine kinase [Clostridia bacterium]|nr:histidine kinase [Clostridia bacterium]